MGKNRKKEFLGRGGTTFVVCGGGGGGQWHIPRRPGRKKKTLPEMTKREGKTPLGEGGGFVSFAS